jgi:MFS family permease
MAIGLSALAFRNASFAVSSHFGIAAFDFGAILVHGLIFGLFIVGAQMYVAENVPERLRSQAQGLMNLMTAGIGVFASNIVFNFILGGASGGARNWTRAYLVAFALSVVGIAAALLLLKGRGDAAEKGDGR